MLLATLFESLIRSGELTLIDADGKRWTFGRRDADTPSDEPAVIMRLHDRSLHWKLALNPGLHAGEAYMDGTMTFDQGRIYDLVALAARNAGVGAIGILGGVRSAALAAVKRAQQFNPVRRSRRNVAHHYDLSGRLYDLFLDADRQYSCAYFPRPDLPLEEAQAAKKRHVAAKLLLKPGQRVLDIGCGWGGLALHLARTADVQVTGITLSTEQLDVARRRAAEAGVADRVRFALRDYRQMTGRFDRIVSVGMFEHVGLPYYPAFFAKVRDLLTEDGVALLHTIGRGDGPGSTNPFIRKYIFPGGYVPALSEVVPVVERSGLFTTDIEVLRMHYALTLRQWRERFLENWDSVARLYDERFCRMWEFYLAGSECAFRYQGHVNFQIQMARRVDAVPITRDYIQSAEQRIAQREGLAA